MMAPSHRTYDAVVVGSGPNGLAAAITMAQAGRSVLLIEACATVGGGARSAELTLPGFLHDVCSAVHPLAIASPFFRTLPLREHGLEWIQPEFPLAHPLDDGTAVIAERSVGATAANLGSDGENYSHLFTRLVADWPKLETNLLGPLRMPKHPMSLARFGLPAMRSAASIAKSYFREERARALFAGMAAHSVLPLTKIPSGAFGLVLTILAHVAGWPFARGGSQNIANALASYLRSLGAEIITNSPISSLDQVPKSRVVLCDVTPRQLATIAGDQFPLSFQRKLRLYRYGPGVCKMDWALNGPIPWKAKQCRCAGTVHIGGTFEEIADSEAAAWRKEHSGKPFVLLAQPTLFDSSRAPAGKHVAWAYCHVPNGSCFDMTERIESQIERFAPGFRSLILKRSVMLAKQLEEYNQNLIGGDIGGGAATLHQLFLRPTSKFYRTPAKGVYICSSSSPPGGGVHGLCGHLAARTALSDEFSR